MIARRSETENGHLDLLLLPGDGVGPEVMRQVRRILDVLVRVGAITASIDEAPVGGASIETDGVPVLPEVVRRCREADGVLLGAVGGPKWDDLPAERRPETGLLQLRREMGVFANLRPVRVSPALRDRSPLREPLVSQGVDMVIVRELTGGLYYGPRGIEGDGATARAHDTLVYSRQEIERLAAVGVRLAAGRRGRLTSVDKANVLASSRLWRQTVSDMARTAPGVEVEHMYVDNCAMQMVLRPSRFDVIITENTFGDILSDLGGALTGSIGMLPSASLAGPGRPGLYEPVHGSAPDIAGTGQANPAGAILSAAMMFRYGLGRDEIAYHIERAVDRALALGAVTPDMAPPGGPAVDTEEMGSRVAELLASRLERSMINEEGFS